MDKVESETALDAKAAEIRCDVFHPGNFDHLVVLDMQIALTAHPAIAAGGANFLCFPGTGLVARIFLDQRTDRAGLNTFAAKYTIRVDVGPIAGGDDFGGRAAIADRMHEVARVDLRYTNGFAVEWKRIGAAVGAGTERGED